MLLEWETISSEMCEVFTIFRVLAELPTDSLVRHSRAGGENVVRVTHTGLALHRAGVGGELGQDQGEEE